MQRNVAEQQSIGSQYKFKTPGNIASLFLSRLWGTQTLHPFQQHRRRRTRGPIQNAKPSDRSDNILKTKRDRRSHIRLLPEHRATEPAISGQRCHFLSLSHYDTTRSGTVLPCSDWKNENRAEGSSSEGPGLKYHAAITRDLFISSDDHIATGRSPERPGAL